MKRKTNLFYTTGPDSKFITFSNYTESLTGNFLSTDTKIFPARFIALYIKGLNVNTKPALIKYLADYYESKLAVLRDYFGENKNDIEKSVPPLNYLLEALLRIKDIGVDNNDIAYLNAYHSVAYQFNDITDFNNVVSYTDTVKFKYISDITEQDYNGTFTDTICNIDLRKYAYISSVELTDDFDNNVVQFDLPTSLYGWDNEIPSEYTGEQTIPDSVQGINLDLYIDNNINTETHRNISPLRGGDPLLPGNEQDDVRQNVKYPIAYIKESTINLGDFSYNSYSGLGLSKPLSYIISDLQEQAAIENKELSYAGAISYILHSPENEFTTLKAVINNMISTASHNNNFVLFYNNDADEANRNIVYMYDGADVFELNMLENNEYNIDPEIIKLNINTSNDDSIEFNCIIPLYDIVDINYKSNFNTIERIISVNGTGEIDLEPSNINKMYCCNVPLGMWFYTEGELNNENTTSVKLYKDVESGFSQSWSLTISSQFKPFPYSSKMPSELTTNSNTNAYATFAQVLASQSAMIDNFNKLNKTIANMNDHIRNLESQLANLGTSYNIDNIHREFNNFEIAMNNKFETLKDDVISHLSYLKWKTTI